MCILLLLFIIVVVRSNECFETPLTKNIEKMNINPQKDIVFIAFANNKIAPMAINWATHMTNINSTFIIGALDQHLLTALQNKNIPSYPMFHELNTDLSHANDNWKTFCRRMITQMREVTELGYHVVLSDVDIVWLKNPSDYFHCNTNINGCHAIKDADVMISSDSLSPSEDAKQGATYARGGIFNTGMTFVKSSGMGKQFLDDWITHLSAKTGKYSKMTTHQQVVNAMVRKGWPGLDPIQEGFTRVLQSGAPLSNGRFLKLGVLPLRLFANGHGYFVTKKIKHPYAVHATYTFDGHSNEAKIYRFQEAGLWSFPEKKDEKFFTFDVTYNISKQPGISAHIKAFQKNLEIIRAAISVSIVTNRTIVFPPLPCYCDKVWGGHDNVFVNNCHYPGSAPEKHLPGTCPLDHFISPSALRKSGVRFVGSLNMTPKVIEMGFKTSETYVKYKDFHHAITTDQRYKEHIQGVRPERWCSECHPHGCANLIDADTLQLGEVLPTRKIYDKFCITIKSPKPVLLMHSNYKFINMTENMLLSLVGVPIERRLVSFDTISHERCQQFPFDMTCISLVNTSFDPNIPVSARRFLHANSLLATLKSGREVLSVDTDVVWLKNPLPTFKERPDIEFFYTSDALQDQRSNEEETLNCGIMYLRPTPWVISIVEEWVQRIINRPIGFQQNLLRDVLREFPKGKTLGLSVSSWSNGHIYFIQKTSVSTIMVHNTFHYAGFIGKVWRFMEANLWKLDFPYDDNSPKKYVTYKPVFIDMKDPGPWPLKNINEFVQKTHGVFMETQLRQLKMAINMARQENSILILPQFKCLFDNVWMPIKPRWGEGGRFPGSSDFKLPFNCPADHVLNLENMPLHLIRPHGWQVRNVQYLTLKNTLPNVFQNDWVRPWCCTEERENRIHYDL